MASVRPPGSAPTSSSRSRSMESSSGYRFCSRSRTRSRSRSSTHAGAGSSGFRSHCTDQERTIMVNKNEVRVTVTSTDLTMQHFLEDVRSKEHKPLIVGFDAEYYQQGDKTALLQICVGERCLLFQLGVAGAIPGDLKRFLAHEGHVFVGVGIANDMDRLRREHQIELSKKVELQAMVPFVIQDKCKWRSVPSLATLGLELLDVASEYTGAGTDVSFRNWHLPILTEAQIRYACTDAFVSYKIGEMLQGEPYGFDLHSSQSPVHAGGGHQQVHLRFVENEQKKIRTCPVCPGRAMKNWKWNEALTHAVYQACSRDNKKRRPHKELLLYHGFQVGIESDDDTGSDHGES